MNTDLSFYNQFAKNTKKVKIEVTNRGVSYLRVSSPEQLLNESLTVQKKGCAEFARKNELELIEQFGNTNESAKTDERKEFQRMLAFVKNPKNKISFILVYSIDRFSRSGAESIHLLNELRKTGKRLISATQNVDTSTSSGIFQQDILLLFSQLDNNLRKEKTVAGMLEKLLKGVWVARVPLGYNQITKDGLQTITINSTGDLIKKAFMMKFKGLSNTKIIAKLATMGLIIHKQRLTEIFKNPFYCGIMIHGINDYKPLLGNHPAIISRDIFDIINGRPKQIRAIENKKQDADLPLKRYIKCANCGTMWVGYEVKSKNKLYYKCNKIGCKCNVSAITMHQKYTDLLDSFSLNSTPLEPLKKQLKLTFEYMNQENIKSVRVLKTQRAEIEKNIDTIDERFALGRFDDNKELYSKLSLKYKQELQQIDVEINKCNIGLSNLDNLINYAVTMTGNLSKLWTSSNITIKQSLQNLVFPDGIIYDKQNSHYRTPKVNSVFSAIADLSKIVGKNKNGQTVNKNNLSALVPGTGLEPAHPCGH